MQDKRARRVEAKQRKKGKADGDDAGDDVEELDALGEPLSDADDEEVDRFLAKQEGMADEQLGLGGLAMEDDEDVDGYDYGDLARAMEAGEGLSDEEDGGARGSELEDDEDEEGRGEMGRG